MASILRVVIELAQALLRLNITHIPIPTLLKVVVPYFWDIIRHVTTLVACDLRTQHETTAHIFGL